MPKKADLANYYSSDELKQKYLKSPDLVESRRWHLLWKVSLGCTIKNSAMAVGFSYTYGKKIVQRYNNLGEKGLENLKNKQRQPSGGKKKLLSQEQERKLRKELEIKPADGGLWTGPKVARWMEKETGVEKVWNQRGWDYLKKFRYSWQRPRPKHRKAEPLEQEKFRQNLPIKVKELAGKYPEAVIDLWFFDEHRVGLKPILRKVWSPIGERPTAIVSHRYEWLYVYGAVRRSLGGSPHARPHQEFVKPKTGETFWYLIPRVNTKWLNLVYQSFAKDAGISQEKKSC